MCIHNFKLVRTYPEDEGTAYVYYCENCNLEKTKINRRLKEESLPLTIPVPCHNDKMFKESCKYKEGNKVYKCILCNKRK